MVYSVRPKVVPHGEKREVTAVVKESSDIELDQGVGKCQIPTCQVGKMTQLNWASNRESRQMRVDTETHEHTIRVVHYKHHSYTEGYTVLEQSARL